VRLIALIAIAVALAAFGLAFARSDAYESTARVLMDASADPVGPSDADSVARRLATAERIVMTPQVLALAAEDVPGESARSLQEKVEASADPDANIIDVTASDEDRGRVASIANAVATAFIQDQQRLARENVRRTRAALRSRLATLGSSRVEATQREALAARLGDLELRAATAGLVFRLVEQAEGPDETASLNPLGVALLALIAGIVVAVLVVVGRDHLNPQVTDAHELSQLTGSPVVARVSMRPGQRRTPEQAAVSMEDDAYRTLRGRVGRLLDSGQQHIVLVTSPFSRDGKDAVSAALAHALAETGHRTLLVTTEPPAETPVAAGQTGERPLVAEAASPGRGEPQVPPSRYVATIPVRIVNTPVAEHLSILADGHSLWDPRHGLGYESVRAFSKALRGLGYRYVVVDAPSLLESNDSLILSEAADAVVVVGRLDSVTRPTAIDMRSALREMNKRVLGLIVVEPQSRGLADVIRGTERDTATPRKVSRWWAATSVGEFPRRTHPSRRSQAIRGA
jgi:capsular polysaccharide biosynthesis protein